jgi:Cytochrome P460
MRRNLLIKSLILLVFAVVGSAVIFQIPKSAMKSLDNFNAANVIDEKEKIKQYRAWTKVNDHQPQIMLPDVAMSCVLNPSNIKKDNRKETKNEEINNNIHKDKYINVYVSLIGEYEMLKKKNPVFPVGTIIVKEKLDSPDSETPELLTVMIKRPKGYNPQVGDWEFMTLNGTATDITSRGKIESCQSCHIGYKQNDYVTRTYLPYKIRENLK